MKNIIFLILLVFSSFSVLCNTIQLVVAASPGGPDDTIARQLAYRIENKDINIVIINKSGASHLIGHSYFSQSNNPILLISNNVSSLKIPNIEEIFNIGYFSMFVYVNKDSNIDSLEDLVARSNKKEIIFGNSGIGTHSYNAMESLCTSKIKCLPINFKSSAETMISLSGNFIDAAAVVSYGATAFSNYKQLKMIHEIKERHWYKLFGKNISDSDKLIIINELNKLDSQFYKSLNIEKSIK